LGSVRYRFINPPPHEIQKIIKFQKLKNIFSTYSMKKSNISWMESITKSVSKDQLIFAGHPHIDSYRHQLKFVIALEDVSIKNGPTEYMAGSQNFNFELFLNYFLTWIYEKISLVERNNFSPKKLSINIIQNRKI